MSDFLSLFDIHNIFVTALGYNLSYLEFAGTVLSLLSVWLVTRSSIWTWPVGNVAVVLFGILFYQIQLYSDFVEQLYFLLTGFYGWWLWTRHEKNNAVHSSHTGISRIASNTVTIGLAALVVFSLLLGAFISRIHVLLPLLFPQPASLPYLDAFTTIMSFAANLLMAHKKLECWPLWIAVDIVGIGLYYSKGVIFVAMLYLVFLVLAIKGLIAWQRAYSEKSA